MAQNRTWTITQSGVSRSFTISPGVGPSGPNNITTSTTTAISGILKGDGSTVSAAVADTDYQSVPAEGAFVDGDKTKLDGIETGADVTDATNVAAAGALMASNNLSDVGTASTARTNLGLGTAAVADTGVANGNVPIWTSSPIVSDRVLTSAGSDITTRTFAQLATDLSLGTLATQSAVDAEDIDFSNSTDIGAALADADEIIVSDGGGNTTRRKSAISRLWTYIKDKIESVTLSTVTISGDLTVDTDTLKVDATTDCVSINGPITGRNLYVYGTLEASTFGVLPALYCNVFKDASPGNDALNLSSRSLFASDGSTTNMTWGTAGTLTNVANMVFATGKQISFSSNSGTWNGATFAGAQTFSGAVTLTSPLKMAGYTVATLPTPTVGMRAYVTDATATTFYSTVAGGGANTVPVFYNGTNWVIA